MSADIYPVCLNEGVGVPGGAGEEVSQGMSRGRDPQNITKREEKP